MVGFVSGARVGEGVSGSVPGERGYGVVWGSDAVGAGVRLGLAGVASGDGAGVERATRLSSFTDDDSSSSTSRRGTGASWNHSETKIRCTFSAHAWRV